MGKLDNYVCDGQMDIFSYFDEQEYLASKKPVTKYSCTIVGVECKAHTNKGCSIPGKCELIKEVVKDNNICKYSEHTCNKEELWKVADSLETECPHTCCRSCKVRMCGARCNGSEEPTPVIEDIKNIPKQCCGVTPWLRKSRCCRWNEENPQMYLMYYICPKCGKTVVDETGWVKNRHGTYEEASQRALEDWNNPETVFEIKEFNDPKNGNYVMCSLDEREEFEKLYGISYEDYKRPLIETANEIYRKKKSTAQN